ncbi:MAG: NAD(P)/FAD-dependent oxidoreductase [Oscillospiraceae bacterium]
MSKKVIIIGGGAAGMMAAIAAGEEGASVVVLERNEKAGRKLYITGKGRCNLTNDCTPEEALRSTPCNGKFLYSAMNGFSPADVMTFFENLGVSLKTERGNRVFPVSDKSTDIIDALVREMRQQRVMMFQDRVVQILTKNGKVVGVETERGQRPCDAVVLATGGASYPLTGSTGDGYDIAEALGHTIVTPKASLVALRSQDKCCGEMQGLALKNIAVKVVNAKGKAIYQDQGELLFTHFGLSGPLILSASSHMRNYENDHYTVVIDLKPALDETKLDARILRDFEENENLDFHNALGGLLPRAMIPIVVERTGIPMGTKVHSVTREQRRRLLETLKGFTVEISGPCPIEEAVITSGGVKVSEIDPKTMASKLVEGLYFAGEIIDVDAYTGGYNLQIAWCTGRAAGIAAAAENQD